MSYFGSFPKQFAVSITIIITPMSCFVRCSLCECILNNYGNYGKGKQRSIKYFRHYFIFIAKKL